MRIGVGCEEKVLRRTIAKIFQMPWILNLIPFVKRELKEAHGICDGERE